MNDSIDGRNRSVIGPLVALALSAGRSPSLTSELGVRRILRKSLHKPVFISVYVTLSYT
jgi:hypothetical protein